MNVNQGAGMYSREPIILVCSSCYWLIVFQFANLAPPLNIRLFDKNVKGRVCRKQTGKTKDKHPSNCPFCAGDGPDKDKIWVKAKRRHWQPTPVRGAIANVSVFLRRRRAYARSVFVFRAIAQMRKHFVRAMRAKQMVFSAKHSTLSHPAMPAASPTRADCVAAMRPSR